MRAHSISILGLLPILAVSVACGGSGDSSTAGPSNGTAGQASGGASGGSGAGHAGASTAGNGSGGANGGAAGQHGTGGAAGKAGGVSTGGAAGATNGGASGSGTGGSGTGGSATLGGAAGAPSGGSGGNAQTMGGNESGGAAGADTNGGSAGSTTAGADSGGSAGAGGAIGGCTTDLQCPDAQFCNGTTCVDDTCKPGATQCAGQVLQECPTNGSAFAAKYTCASPSYRGTTCVDDGKGHAGCTCEDDWDCPANTVCDAGTCSGTGKAPTCSLPPAPFSAGLPTIEIHWGGETKATAQPTGVSPFPAYDQVSSTPLVINLDDDNGDGVVDERDFPEIIFMTYCASNITADGVIRAIHGGGPNKGKDYFANCGGTVWHEGDALSLNCACETAANSGKAPAIGNSTSALAAGDLDGDGKMEIVVPNEDQGLTILDATGDVVATSAKALTAAGDPAVAIANIDNADFAELVVGNAILTLGHDANGKLEFVDAFRGSLSSGSNGQGPISCVGNVGGDSQLEVIAGTTVYQFPSPPPGVKTQKDCLPTAGDAFCKGELKVLWDGQTVNGAAALPSTVRNGFCAIADVLGKDETAAPGPGNAPDGNAEVVVIANGSLLVFNGADGTLRRNISLGAGVDGGAPNVDDFDGDGFPEIGSAFGAEYLMMDLQETSTACPLWPTTLVDPAPGPQTNPARAPGGACTVDKDCATGAVCNKITAQCTCLYNGWSRKTEDDSSAVTGSSVFDFNGDGAAEVVYNDECFFRVFDGQNGNVLDKLTGVSRTRVENPVVADVDNDGNAEIVLGNNNDTSACSGVSDGPNGITVLGDPNDNWVSARRMWNEHAYHITNVTESGAIPLKENEGWKDFNGRTYNTYRSNPRSFGVAPDLTVSGVQLSSPDVACGQISSLLDIHASISNIGDLRVGPGIEVTYYGTWSNPPLTEALHANKKGDPLTSTLKSTLEPGDSVFVSASYDAANNSPGKLPDSVRVVVDESMQSRECKEDNNDLSVPVVAGDQLPDLEIVLGTTTAVCPSATVETMITNVGSAPASNVVVRYYAGDPTQGGSVLSETTIPGPIAPLGGTVDITATIPNLPDGKVILIFAAVDPDNAIVECNDANNGASASSKIFCGKP